MKQLTFSEWEQTYKPIDNTIDTTRGYDGTMFETFGNEVLFVQQIVKADPDKVWTLLDDGDSQVISPGYGHVNRMGYFITKHPFYSYEIEVTL